MKVYILSALLIVGLIPLLIFAIVTLNTYEEKAVENRISEINAQGNMLSNMLLSSISSSDFDNMDIDDEIGRMAEIYNGRILVVNSNLRIIKDTYGIENKKFIISEDIIRAFKGTGKSYHNKEKNYIKSIYPIINKESKEVVGIIIMNISTKEILNIREIMEYKAVIFILSLFLIIFLFSVYYSNTLIKPLNKLIISIDNLTEGYMDEEFKVKGYYEINKISDSFNHMLTKMNKLENSRQEFVSNVSHELKTPITSIKVLADSLLMQEDAPVELYREFLLDITEEIERENKIINDLLSLVKLDKTASDLNLVNLSVNDLLEQILKRLRPIANKRNVELIFESFRPVNAMVDEVKITLAISNLVENAIKYNVEDGWVRISLNADHKYFYIKVIDSGIGIPEESQSEIFERFYRIDKTRSRETGGTGLGLSITKNIIQMHRGIIKLYSKEGEGTTFNVRIPLNYIS